MATGMRLLILLHGDNLLRADLQPKYRLSPDTDQPLRAAELLSLSALSEWRVGYLVERKVRQASTLTTHYDWCV